MANLGGLTVPVTPEWEGDLPCPAPPGAGSRPPGVPVTHLLGSCPTPRVLPMHPTLRNAPHPRRREANIRQRTVRLRPIASMGSDF